MGKGGGGWGGMQQGPQETNRAAIWDDLEITKEWLDMIFPSSPNIPHEW